MINFVPLMDLLGEPATIALTGLFLAFAFGFAAERSSFCTRSGLLEVLDGKPGAALSTWLAAFGVAILLVQGFLSAGLVEVSDSRFFSGVTSLSGPIIGGLLFGLGMALARGCTSRLLVLGATGNLRAVTAVFFMMLAAYASMSGFLQPVREGVASVVDTSILNGNRVGWLQGSGVMGGMLPGVICVVVAFVLAVWRNALTLRLLGGAVVGAVVAAMWIATYSLSSQLFDPIAVEGLSFIRPLGGIVEMTGGPEADRLLTLDNGIMVGIVFGALLASVLFRSFAIQRFSDEGAPHFLRYVFGGSLMGFGGVLAGGCTIGAGFSGGSVLATSSLLALASMLSGSLIAETVLRGLEQWNPRAVMVPAE